MTDPRDRALTACASASDVLNTLLTFAREGAIGIDGSPFAEHEPAAHRRGGAPELLTRMGEEGSGVIAALFVQDGGAYFGMSEVDPWPEARDARRYAGPWPVVAHPPCQRWGKLWAGQPLWIKRAGELAFKGGGTDSAPRIGTPEPFRDLLLGMARSARRQAAG